MREIKYTEPGPYAGENSTRCGLHIASKEKTEDGFFVEWLDAGAGYAHLFSIETNLRPILLTYKEAQALRNVLTGWLVREGVEREVRATV